MGMGLDDVHPFGDTTGIDHLLRECEEIFLHTLDTVGAKNAARIWGFISKFVMLDRFVKALGIPEEHMGILVSRKLCEEDYLGTGLKVSIFIFNLPDHASNNVDLRS